MTALELAILMAKCADEGLEPLKAFTTATKAGLTNYKRDDFEREYQTLVESPFLRRMKVRVAREDQFKDNLSRACLATDPPEEDVLVLAQKLAMSKQSPPMVVACIEAFRPLMKEGVAEDLMAQFNALWKASNE